MRLAALGTVLLTMVCAAALAPAGAADQKDVNACNGSTSDGALAACARIVNAAVALPQMRAIAQMYIAQSWLIKEDYDRAIAEFTKALRFDSKFAFAYDRRGHAWSRKGNYEKAIADYNAALKLDPKFIMSLSGRCRARAVGTAEHYLALANCNESLALHARDVNALESRGIVYIRLNRLKDAVADFNAALAIEPRLHEALFGRGVARIKLGEVGPGEADIRAAGATKANVADIFAGYGIFATGFEPPSQAPAQRASDSPAEASAPPMEAGMSAATEDSQHSPVADCTQAETHWKTTETLGVAAAYEDHLAHFGSCVFAGLAKLKLDALKKK